MKDLLDTYVQSTRKLQVKFKDNGPPVGPGVVTNTKVDGSCGLVDVEGCYTIAARALIAGPGGRPVEVDLEVFFTAESVLWATEGPSEPLIAVPTPRGPGGLHIG